MRIPRRTPIYPYGDNEALYFGYGNDVGIYWDGANLAFNPLVGETMTINFAAGITTFYGASNTTDDLRIRANNVDLRPSILLQGNGNTVFDVPAASQLQLNIGGYTAWRMAYAANVTTIIGGETSGDNTIYKANNVDADATIVLEGLGDVAINPTAGSFLKYGTHNAHGDVVCDGHIVIEDSGGAAHKLMTTA